MQRHMKIAHGNRQQMGAGKQSIEQDVSSHNSSQDNPEFHFMHPFTMLVAAGSGFGKTYWVKRLLAEKERLIQPTPKRIVWCYTHWQPLYDQIWEIEPNIEFLQGLPINLDAGFFDKDTTNLMIVDDMMTDITKDNRLNHLYTRGSHHENLSVICLLQNLYYKNTQTMRRNSHYLILFDMPMDKTQIRTMSHQMFPSHPNYLLQTYNTAVSKPYGYLVVVSKPNVKQHDRLKTDIFHDDKPKKEKLPEKRKHEEDLNKISQVAKKPLTHTTVENYDDDREQNSGGLRDKESPRKRDDDEQNMTTDKPVMIGGQVYRLEGNQSLQKKNDDDQSITTDKPVLIGGQAYRVVEVRSANKSEHENKPNIQNEAALNPINRDSSDEDDQSSTDNESDNMHACKYCGALFEGKYHLVQHELECKKLNTLDDQEPFENEGFKLLRKKAKSRNEKEWVERVEKYEKKGMSTQEAKKKANEKLEAKDKKEFLEIYTNLVKLQVQLGECPLHLDLVDHVKELLDITDLKMTQAVKRALSKKKRDLESVMDVDSDDEDEKENKQDKETDMEESDKDESDNGEGEEEEEVEEEEGEEEEEEDDKEDDSLVDVI